MTAPLTLSAEDQARFAAALQTLLAPLDYGGLDAWRSAANEQLKALVGADAAVFELPRSASPRPVFTEDYPDAPPEEYLALHWPLAEKYGIMERIVRLGVATGEERWRPAWEEYLGSAYLNEFLLPHRMFHAVALAASTRAEGTSGVSQVILHRTTATAPAFGEREKALLRLLHPAFWSGVETWLRLGAHTAVLAAALDEIGVALALVALHGGVLHQTPALTALLQGEPERERLTAAVVAAARAVAGAQAMGTARAAARPIGPTPSALEVATARGWYRVRASTVAEGAFGPDPVALVLVERAAAPPASDDVLRARYGLTRQEVRVARLLAERRTNEEIAAALFVSLSTARHHVGHVLEKLEVRSRKDVAAALAASR